MRASLAVLPFAAIVGLLLKTQYSVANRVPVRINRWLEVRQMAGSVSYQRGRAAQPAQIGTRLQEVGDTLSTGSQSNARLSVDTGIGFLQVAEDTIVRVQRLQVVPDGGRITHLEVPQGQVRLQIRPLTHPSSEVEIHTPAGVSGVRGTDFGVSIQPDGKMGVATLEGGVVVEAQQVSVPINQGFQNLTIPGEPPLPPVPLTEDTRLDVQRLATEGQAVYIQGQVDPVNLLILANTPQTLSRTGRFASQVALPRNRRVEAVVITPLGKRQVYELVVP
jgi:hypothetical protein